MGMSDWDWQPAVDRSMFRGCWVALLLVIPVWVLLGIGVYWLGHR